MPVSIDMPGPTMIRRASVIPCSAALTDPTVPKRRPSVVSVQHSALPEPVPMRRTSVAPLQQSASLRKKREGLSPLDSLSAGSVPLDSSKLGETAAVLPQDPPTKRTSVTSQCSGISATNNQRHLCFGLCMEGLPVPNAVPQTVEEVPEDTTPGGLTETMTDAVPPMSEVRKGIAAEKMKRISTWESPQALQNLRVERGPRHLRTLFSVALTVAQHVVASTIFEYVTSTCIVLNAIAAGVQAEYTIRSLPDETPSVFRVLEVVFLVAFGAEFTLRAAVLGVPDMFFQDKEGGWNLLDACILVLHLLDEAAISFVVTWGPMDFPATFSLVRAARLTRLVRIMRVFRLMAMFQDLRAMVESIGSSCKSLVWTSLLFLLLTYVTGVYLTDLVAEQARKDPRILFEGSLLGEYYGTTPRALLSMFQAVTGGVDWNDLLQPLIEEVSPAMALPFTLYIAFTVLAMMNVITGIFVESSLATARVSKDAELLNSMCALFLNTDKDRSGMISWEEFAGKLQDPDMARCFRLLDIELSEARGLFTLLDTDTSGEIDAEEFIMGCLRLQGTAKAIDLATLMYFNKRIATWWSSQMKAVHETLADISCACGCRGDEPESSSEEEYEEEADGESPSPKTPRAPRAATASQDNGSDSRNSVPSRSWSGAPWRSSREPSLAGDSQSLAEFATWSGLKSRNSDGLNQSPSSTSHQRLVTA